MVDTSATCKKQLIINYNFFDRAHCCTDRTIALSQFCVFHGVIKCSSTQVITYLHYTIIQDNYVAITRRRSRSHLFRDTGTQHYTRRSYSMIQSGRCPICARCAIRASKSSPVTVLMMSLDVLLARLHLLRVMVHNTFESMLCTYILTRHRNIISRDILLDVCTKLLQSTLSSTKFTSLHLRDIQSAQVSLLDGTSSLFFLHQHSKTKPLSCAHLSYNGIHRPVYTCIQSTSKDM